jgi:rod shape determining protein RodA
MFKGLFDFKNQNLVFKWSILIPVIFYIIIGLFALSSTSSFDSFISSTFYKQLLWLFIGAIAFILVQYVRVQYLNDYSYIYFFLLFILILSTQFSPVIEGSQRWIIIGGIYFQPSELGKIIYVLGLSRVFSDYKIKNKFSKLYFMILLIAFIPPMLVFKQPDLGTAIIYLSLIIPILFWSKFETKLILLLVAPMISMIAVSNIYFYYLWMIFLFVYVILINEKLYIRIINLILNFAVSIISPIIWDSVLKQHQRDRIETFLDPFSDPLGSGYQVIQSMITIGSGGFWGKGIGNGTQTGLEFLPVRDTDFIVSVISEEMGFSVIFLIMISLAWMSYRVFDYAQRIENEYASTVLIGLFSIIFMHFIINLSMIAGLLPVTGLPVPFISYGGTFFLTCSIIVGLMNNIINNQI